MSKGIAIINQSIILSIIIVNYNVKEYILNCIQSIQDKVDVNRCPYEVIVSDNGSVDGSVEAIRERFPWVKVIENNANLGFGKANNIGAEQAEGKVLFYLNPDTLIKGGIEDMVYFVLEHSEIGVAAPVLYNSNNTINFQAGYYMSIAIQIITVLTPLPILTMIAAYKKHMAQKCFINKTPFIIELVTGCAMMFRKDVFNKIGGFDNNIFMYDEEIDLHLMLKQSHYKSAIYNTASIIHFEEKSASKYISNTEKVYMCAKSLKYILKKHFHLTWRVRYLLQTTRYARHIITSFIKVITLFIMRKDYKKHVEIIKHTIADFKVYYSVLINKPNTTKKTHSRFKLKKD